MTINTMLQIIFCLVPNTCFLNLIFKVNRFSLSIYMGIYQPMTGNTFSGPFYKSMNRHYFVKWFGDQALPAPRGPYFFL